MKSEFTIQDMLPIAITLVVLGIAVSYGLSVMSDIEEDFCDDGVWDDGMCWNCDNIKNSTYIYSGGSNLCLWVGNLTHKNMTPNVNKEGQASNATRNAITGVAKIPEKLPLIVTVIIAAIIIGIIVRYLFTSYGGT